MKTMYFLLAAFLLLTAGCAGPAYRHDRRVDRRDDRYERRDYRQDYRYDRRSDRRYYY